MDWKLELITIPVTDVDRARDFYVKKLGFHLDHDQTVNKNLRFVQLTPVGSACSIAFGIGITDMKPGSVKGLQMVVPSIKKAHAELAKRGTKVSKIEKLEWGSFVYFDDPDGNAWAVQQLPPRKKS